MNFWASDGTVTIKRLGRVISHLTRSHSPFLCRYLPDSTKVAVMPTFVARRCFHWFQVESHPSGSSEELKYSSDSCRYGAITVTRIHEQC